MNNDKSWRDEFDIIEVDHWEVPDKNDARILTQPNIVYPLHSLAPRTVLGVTAWNHIRKATYAAANNVCEICGGDHRINSHELYNVDYAKQEATFVRTICVDQVCHQYSIHTGRALTLYKQGNPLYTKERLLEGAEHCFTIISSWNREHPGEEPLRVFSAWLDYLKQPDLEKPMRELIKKYDIKFYKVSEKWWNRKRWSNWKLRIGNKWYNTPYADRQAWEKAMAAKAKDPHDDHGKKSNLSGGVFDEIDKFLKENAE